MPAEALDVLTDEIPANDNIVPDDDLCRQNSSSTGFPATMKWLRPSISTTWVS